MGQILDKRLLAGFLGMMDQVVDNLDLRLALQTARRAGEKGREVLLHYWGQLKNIKEKANAGLVSEADLQSENEIRKILLSDFPDHQMLGEEESFNSPQNVAQMSAHTAKPLWIVDPLDGTTNFVHGFPIFAVSIGLFFAGQTHVAVVNAPALDEEFIAARGQGTFLNDKPLRVSERFAITEALLATGFFHHDETIQDEQMRIFSKLVYRSRGVRRAGAAAYDMCMVAKGVFDGFWERHLQPWDTCAGSLLIEESGGVVTSYDGQPFNPFMSTVVAGNPKLHKVLLAEISS